MIELKEKELEKIKNAKDARSVDSIINTSIIEMKKNGIEDYRIAIFIRQLDISLLLLKRTELTDKQWDNVKLAQKILINKIINGIRHDFAKNN